MNRFRTLLVPTDFSESSTVALREAVALARAGDAEIVLLHVMQDVHYPTGSVLRSQSFPNIREEIRKGVEAHLQELKDSEIGAAARARMVVSEGVPSVEIADVAREVGADLIVISTHGYSGLKRFLLGSTTERVLRIAPCSVLVVR